MLEYHLLESGMGKNSISVSLRAWTSHIMACTLLYYEDIFFLHLSKSTLCTQICVKDSREKTDAYSTI